MEVKKSKKRKLIKKNQKFKKSQKQKQQKRFAIAQKLNQSQQLIQQQDTNYLLPCSRLLQTYNQYQLGNFKKVYHFKFHEKWNTQEVNCLNSQYFFNKNVLDVGCGQGHITLQIAMKYSPKLIRGIDVDSKLIKEALKNLEFIQGREIQREVHTSQQSKHKQEYIRQELDKIIKRLSRLPQCFLRRMEYPKLDIQPNFSRLYTVIKHTNLKSNQINLFPKNIEFANQNIYLLESILKYDCILLFSITKYIHLTFGDSGIRRMFQKCYELLNDDGILILQPHDFEKYKQIKNKTAVYRKNYQKIKLKPEYFSQTLRQIGFIQNKVIQPDPNQVFTIKRAIYIYSKIALTDNVC